MFGIGFFEIVLLFVITLVVLGPERLPQVIKVSALWMSRIKRKWTDIREEVEKEIGADDIRQTLHNERVLYELKKAGYDEDGNLINKNSADKKEEIKSNHSPPGSRS